MIWLLAIAWGATPPEIDLDDTDRWDAGAEAFSKGPAGCWSMTGTVELRLMHDTGASGFGKRRQTDRTVRGTLKATFTDHRWTQFHYTLDAEREMWMMVRPFWGEVDDDAVQVVDEAGEPVPLEDTSMFGKRGRNRRAAPINADRARQTAQLASVEYVQWNDETREVELVKDASLQGIGSGNAITVYRFAEGAPIATGLDITLPSKATFGTWPMQVMIKEGRIHIRGFQVGGAVLPHAQRFSGIGGVFGQTFGVDSVVAFTEARRCTSEP